MIELLLEEDAPDDPIELFVDWFDGAVNEGLFEVNAMTLATASRDGRVSARMVLLKGVDQRGFRFYTNYSSRKAADMGETGRAALVFHWQPLGRQVRVEGTVERLPRSESEAYFATRPRGSQIGAHASAQSSVVASRADVDRSFHEAEEKFAVGEIPCPEDWGGYIVIPDEIEFWVHRADRMHDRLRYRRADAGWIIERLMP